MIPSAHAGALADARVEIIANAGHMVQMESAARVNALIKAQLCIRARLNPDVADFKHGGTQVERPPAADRRS